MRAKTEVAANKKTDMAPKYATSFHTPNFVSYNIVRMIPTPTKHIDAIVAETKHRVLTKAFFSFCMTIHFKIRSGAIILLGYKKERRSGPLGK